MKKKHSWRLARDKKTAVCRDCGCTQTIERRGHTYYNLFTINGKQSSKTPPCTMEFPTGIDHLILERNKHFKAGRTVEQDAEINTRHQLTYAAMMLLHIDYDRSVAENFDIIDYAHKYCPPYWNEEHWLKMLNESYFERVKIAGSLLAGELDRIMYTSDETAPSWVPLPEPIEDENDPDATEEKALGDLIGSIWADKNSEYKHKSASITLSKEPSDQWIKVYFDEGYEFVKTMLDTWILRPIAQ